MSQRVDIPIIKLFLYKNSFYCYDTYQNQLLRVSKEHYLEICRMLKIGLTEYLHSEKRADAYEDICSLARNGFFKARMIDKIEHPDTKYVPFLTDRCINQLILGVTSACNFKCRYCHQAKGAVLSESARMSLETARRSIDFLYRHSKDAADVAITFYGGEPLLNFDLIKAAVLYADSLFFTKRVSYNITTNASLLTDDMVDFFVRNDFAVLVSLDGDSNVQNRHRKFLRDGGDTFDHVWKNVMKIKKDYPAYYDARIRFHSVIFQDEDPDEIIAFFGKHAIPEEAVSIRSADLKGIDYSYSSFWINKGKMADRLQDDEFRHLVQYLNDKTPIPAQWHHNGPCVPAVRRLFVNADGVFYPCEKVDCDPSCVIGDLDDGINVEKIVEMLNIARLTQEECMACWALRFCSMCVLNCADDGKWSREKKLEACRQKKNNAFIFLQRYIDSLTMGV